jgi:hypothetical protein
MYLKVLLYNWDFQLLCFSRLFEKKTQFPKIPGIPGKLQFNSRFPGRLNSLLQTMLYIGKLHRTASLEL